MHPAQRALPCVEGQAALDESRIEAALLKFQFAPGASEKASLVLYLFGREEKRARQFRFSKKHVSLIS